MGSLQIGGTEKSQSAAAVGSFSIMHVGRWVQRPPPPCLWVWALTHSGLTVVRQTNSDTCDTPCDWTLRGLETTKKDKVERVTCLWCLFFFHFLSHCVRSGQAEATQKPFVELLAHSILNSRLLSLPGGGFSWVYPWLVIGWALRRGCWYHSQDFLSPWHLATSGLYCLPKQTELS